MQEKDIIVCRCEGITFQELKETADMHQCSARELKLRTRAGMGVCGGRTCRSLVDRCAYHVTDENRQEIPLKYQPPVRMVDFETMGGSEHD